MSPCKCCVISTVILITLISIERTISSFPAINEPMNPRKTPRSHGDPPPSSESVQNKLWRIVSRHEQVKVAFRQLHSQIRTGLLEV